MTKRARASWLVYALGALCIGAVLTAILIVGPTSQSATVSRRVVTVGKGVVQSTVTGSGDIQAATELDLGFKTSGVVQRIAVSAGQHVTAGQMIAELDPQTAEVTLESARARLQAAEASLAQEEEDSGESSSSQVSGETGASANAASANAANTIAARANPTTDATALAADISTATPTPVS